MSDNLEPPIITVIQTAVASNITTKVETVILNSHGLSISMSSQHWDAILAFKQTYGFRVLDELDLTEFWSYCTLNDGWLFEVNKGGWKELELKHLHFHSGREQWVREYLIDGLNECVSVLTKEEPSISVPLSRHPPLKSPRQRIDSLV